MPTPSVNAVKVFLSYAHADEALCDELRKHLSVLRRQHVIQDWYDRQILPGGNWAGAIADELNAARIILLLVSADFLASNYCYDIELKQALARHTAGKAVVVPVILRECDWQNAPFSHIQALPKGAKPVTSWINRDEALTQVIVGLRRAIANLHPTTAESGPPQLGTLVYRMCNRTTQEDDFYSFFQTQVQQQPGWPHLYFLRGPEQECPESLVERLTRTIIQEYAHDRWGEQHGAVTSKFIEWPDTGETSARQKRLLARLYREFDRPYSKDSPGAFAQAFATALDSVIVLRHSLHVERWGGGERTLLEWYLRFWDEVAEHTPKPLFIVFCSLLYPTPAQHSGWRAWFKRDEFAAPAFGAEVQTMLAQHSAPLGCPRLLLEELASVERHHVKSWFDKHNLFEEGIRAEKCAALFREQAARPMAEIELALKQIHLDFITQRSY
jgi:hypothetical protein